MGKNVKLANIYIKIYNKRPLTMEDLAFLAKYDRECFEKTCHNLVYNVPETKELMQPKKEDAQKNASEQVQERSSSNEQDSTISQTAEIRREDNEEAQSSDKIRNLLENLKTMEVSQFDIQKLNVDNVKQLLGSLYMELLFPHNDRDKTFEMGKSDDYSTFNKKA